MGTFSKHTKRSLHRRGKQLLKSKVGLYKRKGTTLLRMKSKNKLFAPIIVLPAKLQPSRLISQNSIQLVHTSTTTKKKKTPSTPKLSKIVSAPSSPMASDRSTSSVSSFASARRKLKKLKTPLKKMLGIKKKKKSDPMNDVRPWEPKDIDDDDVDDDGAKTPPKTILIVGETNSVETTPPTNPNTPLSTGSYNNDMDNIEIREHLDVTPSNESSAGKSGPFIFSDTDDEMSLHDETNKLRSSDKEKIESSIDNIQTKVELELSRLDEKLKTQKAERVAVAQKQLETAMAEEKEGESCKGDLSNKSDRKSQNVGIAKTKHNRFLFVAFLLFPVALVMHLFFSKEFATSYSHDMAMQQAQDFFGTTSAMKGTTVVLSETTSKLGSTIGGRFSELGATVTSLQDDIDCNDLDSIATAVDSILKKHNSIDYLIQTGNLCLDPSKHAIQPEPTVQGHDSLVGGHYLSAFMLTQKILPKLEQSKHGTLVQFTSKLSNFADESKIQSEIESMSEGAPTSLVAQIFNLPRRFAYVKMFESIQHRVIARGYPNVRSMEISRGWIGVGEMGANHFFDRIFQEEENALTVSSFENEDQQENVYEWSQNAVWKWVAPPTPSPVAEMILGSPPTPKAVARAEQNRPSASVSRYLPASASTMITSGALALVAMKAKTYSWWQSE